MDTKLIEIDDWLLLNICNVVHWTPVVLLQIY